jgi:predicted porin
MRRKVNKVSTNKKLTLPRRLSFASMHIGFLIPWSRSVDFGVKAPFWQPHSKTEILALQHFGDYSMKKTQFALAALALVASTAAMAADVTVYGTADVSVVRTDVGTSMAGAGNSAGSIFGVKGTEDLGSGLKASFNLETGYTGTNGALANGGAADGTTVIFNRQANVGLSNENVGITLGTQISPFIVGELNGATAVGGNGAFVPGLFILNGGNLAGTTQSVGGFFIPDAASISLSANGVSANVLTRTRSATATTGGVEADKYTAANIGTTIADISLNLAYQQIDTGLVVTKNTVLSANTTVAGIRINGAYADNSNGDGTASGKTKGFLVGASMPLAGALSGGLTYASNKDSGLGNQKTVSLQYNFSKSTYAYLNYSKFSVATALAGNDSGNLGTAEDTKSMTAIGIAKSF